MTENIGQMLRERLRQLLSTGWVADLLALAARLSAYGTEGYPPHVRRRLKIMNVTAYLVALFTFIYAIQHITLDLSTWGAVIFINIAMGVLALLIPFMHRYGELVGPITITLSELFGIFALTYYVGSDAGLHLQYFAATAAFFVILGLERPRLIAAFVALAFVLHLACWAWFPQSKAILDVDPKQLKELYLTAVITTFSIISIVVYYAFRLAERAQAETDALLHNMLPDSVVDRLKGAPEATIADEFAEASVMFADLQGFVSMAKRLGPARTVDLLNTIVMSFDKLAEVWGVEKIKTIGDAYMVAAGVPERVSDHAQRLARMALAMQHTVGQIAAEKGVALALRIGIASGPLLAGVIGAKRLTYDVWGDTVNLASRLEGRSEPNRILVSDLTRMRLEGQFTLQACGPLDLKGFGEQIGWYLVGPVDAGARAAIHTEEIAILPVQAASPAAK